MAELSPPRPEHGEDDAARLLLDALRREADAWGKRLERSDDAAGGLLTACLTVGVVGAAAAGYVKDHARASLWMVEVGVAGLCVVGAVTLLSRTFGPALIARFTGRKVVRPTPPCSFGDDENPLGRLLRDEQHMAADRKAVARIREVIVGSCLVGFAASVLMILWGAFTALDNAP